MSREETQEFLKGMEEQSKLRSAHLVQNFTKWSGISSLSNIHPMLYCKKIVDYFCQQLASMQFIEGKLHQHNLKVKEQIESLEKRIDCLEKHKVASHVSASEGINYESPYGNQGSSTGQDTKGDEEKHQLA